jgi:formylglycine-generating enzyme required for sulfatase activity/predicted Ser/Thr protein kinase
MSSERPNPEDRRLRAEALLRAMVAATPDAAEAELDALVAAHPELADELRAAAVALGCSPTVVGAGAPASALERAHAEQLLAGLGETTDAGPRYQVVGEIGRGGMGVVLRVLDKKLERHLAMKLILGKDGPAAMASTDAAKQVLRRFLNEARITGQLQHPGIVPVHEVGVDKAGRAFFTMKLVQGRTLADVFDAMHAGDAEWHRNRVLSLVQRMCEALAYAHDRGVVHRDLKPSNVMIGDFGEVYIMDWGLARELGKSAEADPVPSPADLALENHLELTRSGVVLGTPSYMPPEQAAGRLGDIDARSDIYAVGAMLHELIAGHPPYCDPESASVEMREGPMRGIRLLRRILAGPPPALCNRDVAPELVAICERGMHYERERRYANAQLLADDLRSFLEGRVVSAHATGAWAEAKKWVQRNRGLSAALAGVLLTAIAGAWIAGSYAVQASAKAAIAQRTIGEFEQLAAVVRLREVEATEKELYPAWPANRERIERWLRDGVGGLTRMMPDVERAVTTLEAEATTLTSVQPDEGISRQSRELLHENLVALLSGVQALQNRASVIERIELRWAAGLEDWTRAHPGTRHTWAEAAEAIAKADDVVASRRYRDSGIRLVPQMGLVPIGMNPVTKLWEFYDLRSAWDPTAGIDPAAIPIPQHADDGRIEVGQGTGIVFVLLPGGAFTMGSQNADPTGPNFDPEKFDDDQPLASVDLAPFFVARHELTQPQWCRLGNGGNPSRWRRGSPDARGNLTGTEPVENVDWFAADALMRRHGCELPTEAQWEFVARGGTTTPWCFGQRGDLVRTVDGVSRGVINVADQALWAVYKGINPEPWNDGHAITAPVGWSLPNDFGLFDVHGNVWEWCRDWKCSYETPARPGDGLREPGPADAGKPQARQRCYRGGGIFHPAAEARSADRMNQVPDFKSEHLGVRAVRPLRLTAGS